MTYELIETITLTSSASSIEFTDIPQDGTDLVLFVSARPDTASIRSYRLHINNETSGTNYSQRTLEGDGSSAYSTNETSQDRILFYVAGGTTANTFGSTRIYFSNYAGSTAKPITIDNVTENNATTAYQQLHAANWNNTAAITSIRISDSSVNTLTGSTASLYKITAINDPALYASPKATGGSISLLGTDWVHTFTSSGTFTPTESLTNVEYLVIAGGGGGGNEFGGGGGAGGYRTSVTGDTSGGGASAESKLSLNSGQNYTVTVGAGGAGATTQVQGGNGSNSVFGSITATGGGGGGGSPFLGGASGGSGGGGRQSTSGGSGTANQGFDGADGSPLNSGRGGGGGAGAAAVDVAATNNGGNGGNGVASTITGSSVTRAGGGGGSGISVRGTGGSGGGGDGGIDSGTSPVTGTTNTGSGGGGGANFGSKAGANGGSGIVIVRYPA